MGAKLSFELDAGKILAKLHRGGCQTRKGDAVFINTGILDDASIDPEKVDKNKINFDMEGGEYELGVIFLKDPALDIELIDTVIADIAKKDGVDIVSDYLKSNNIKKDKLSNQDWKKLYKQFQDKHKGDHGLEFEKFKEIVFDELPDEIPDKEHSANQQGADGKNTPITDNPKENNKTNESLMVEDYTKMDPKQGVDFAAIQAAMMMANPQTQEIDKLAKRAEAAGGDAKKAVDKNRDAIKKFMEKNINWACQYLQDYMKTFAGEEEANKIKPEDVNVTYIPEKFADPYKNKKYDKYQIPALTDEEVRQEKIRQLKDMQKTKKNEISFKNMCFKIAYSLDIGK